MTDQVARSLNCYFQVTAREKDVHCPRDVRVTCSVVVALVVATVLPVLAHHSFSAEFDSTKSVTLAGEVVMMEWVNPHSWLHIDVKKPDSSVERWKIEGGSPSVLFRLGWNRDSVPAGTKVTVVGFQAKDDSLRASSRELRFPDGRRMDLGGSGGAQK